MVIRISNCPHGVYSIVQRRQTEQAITIHRSKRHNWVEGSYRGGGPTQAAGRAISEDFLEEIAPVSKVRPE